MAAHNARPTLGYPSQTEAIIALYLRGFSNMTIREHTGAPRGTVGRAIHEYRWSRGLPTTTHAYRARDRVRSASL